MLGKLVLEKSAGVFEGKCNFAGNSITIYVEVEWSSKATWKKPLSVARDFATNIASKDEAFREYIYSVGYDDGNVFGGHEIDVDVNSKGEMICAEMR